MIIHSLKLSLKRRSAYGQNTAIPTHAAGSDFTDADIADGADVKSDVTQTSHKQD